MPITDVDVCNKALVELGQSQVSATALSAPATAVERVLAKLYPEKKLKWLSVHPWRFTVKRAQLVAAATPVNRWSYAWSMPVDAVQGTGPLAMFSGAGARQPTEKEWDFTAGVVETNFTPAWADYQFLIGEALWPPLFLDYAVAALAADIAKPITEASTQTIGDLLTIAIGTPQEKGGGGRLGEAKRLLDKYRPPQTLFKDGDGPLVSARFG